MFTNVHRFSTQNVRGQHYTRTSTLASVLVGLAVILGGPAGSVQAQIYESAKVSAADGAPYDRFGESVDISGVTAVVGSPRNDDAGSSSGSAYVFVFDGNRWVQVAKLTASDARSTDLFGTSVAISGDIVVVGAPYSDHTRTDAGAVYLYKKPVGGWMDMTETAVLTASDGVSGDGFGSSVDIDLDTVAVGAPQNLSQKPGKAYVFEKPSNGWEPRTETAIISSSVRANGDRFGEDVAVSGEIVVVGAPGLDAFGQSAGAAFVFARPVGGWIGATETAVLHASDARPGDELGFSVATSGATAVAGAPYNDTQTSDAGAAYLFNASPGGWKNDTETAKFLASRNAPIDEFGHSVAMQSEMVIVGAHKSDIASNNAGAAFVFLRPKDGWKNALDDDVFIASDASNADGFGTSVATDGFLAVSGCPYDDDRGTDSGTMYSVDLTPPCLTMEIFNLRAGEEATFVVRNGIPKKSFVVVYGLGGLPTVIEGYKGYCATFGFGYINKKNVLGYGQFNSEGVGNLAVPISPDLIGFTIKVQAAERFTCPDECMSNLIRQEVE